MYELTSRKSKLLCLGGYGASLGCSLMDLNYAKVMVAEELCVGSPGPASAHNCLRHLSFRYCGDVCSTSCSCCPSRHCSEQELDVFLLPYCFSSCASHVAWSESVTCPGGHLYVCPFRCVTAIHNAYHIPPGPSEIALAFFFCSLTPFFNQASLGLWK